MAQVQEQRHCSRHGHDRGYAGRYLLGGVSTPLDDCPAALVSAGGYSMLRAYGHWADGRMWHAGPVSAQGAKYVRAMEIIGGALVALRQAERDAVSGGKGR